MENGFNFCQQMGNGYPYMGMIKKDSGPSLSYEEFDALIKSVQLLRISQLRYIVQKYSIPASGNKTKLLSLVIKIFHSLRFDKSLIDILNEVNRLLADQQDSFSISPITSVPNNLEICDPDPNYFPLTNPLYEYIDESPFFGPILVPPGQSNGKFTFTNDLAPNNSMFCLTFYFKNGKTQQLSLNGSINGSPFDIFPDDPYPQPIDLTGGILPTNVLELRIQAPSQMMICINRYQYSGIQAVANRICGQAQPLVIHNSCTVHHPFPLVPFLSKAISTDNWKCPICNEFIQISQIEPYNIGAVPTEVMENEIVRPSHMFSFDNNPTIDIFSQQQNDIFNIDWDGFS
ncbi:MIZ zinc finger family protein [Histomonas meleagridis]|uniref:MIZ zinc finger family protein n=1 Tax=Histomonas meleagridis TaxID=135588 RepID=UPI00355A6E66|nr:MIZ zinc finger family protein [Histomonas meleagridis]KAH0800371.1 MIZ zinc finger family protein [Histomonas meleagridis]